MASARHPLARQIKILSVVGVLALATAGFAAFQLTRLDPSPFHGTRYPDTPPAPEFALVSHTGETVSLRDFHGRPLLLFFGFTSCPDFCPLTLSRLSEIVAEGGDALHDVQILLVTVDPSTDTPQRLADYVRTFGPAVTGLTGTPEQMLEVFADYGVYAETRPAHDGQPSMAHTPVVFGIDRAGRLQVLIHPDERRELVSADIHALATLPPS